eukprot:4106675-Pleurochrysis_carterae.AAC.3
MHISMNKQQQRRCQDQCQHKQVQAQQQTAAASPVATGTSPATKPSHVLLPTPEKPIWPVRPRPALRAQARLGLVGEDGGAARVPLGVLLADAHLRNAQRASGARDCCLHNYVRTCERAARLHPEAEQGESTAEGRARNAGPALQQTRIEQANDSQSGRSGVDEIHAPRLH